MSFSDDIRNFRNKTEHAAAQVLRGTALDLFGKVVKRTPVGNPSLWASPSPKGYIGGSLRANWQIQINTKNMESDKKANKNSGSTIRRESGKLNSAKLTDTIYILNNLPYAKRVEDGWSSQAPHGMVKVTVREFQRIVKSRARNNKV